MIKFPSTYNTPAVIIDNSANKMSIEGICTPENPLLFFNPIYLHFKELLETKRKTSISFDFEYFNTGSSRCILDMCKIANEMNAIDRIHVAWKYSKDDLEMRESGEVISSVCGFPFSFIEKD